MADWLAEIFRQALAPQADVWGGRPSSGWGQPPLSLPRYDASGLAAPSMLPTAFLSRSSDFMPLSVPPRYSGKASAADYGGGVLSPKVAAMFPAKKKAAAGGQATGYAPVGQVDMSQLGAGVSANVMKWLPLAEKYAAQNGLPVEAVLAIIQNESGGNEKATSVNNPGYGTAKGLMQTLDLHYKPGEDPYDPETNIRAGTRYLGEIYKRRGGDTDKLMAEYFGGGGAFDAAGNIIRTKRDANISIGDYIDKKWRPALSAYQAEIGRQRSRATTQVANAGPAAWREVYKNGTLTPDQFQSGLSAADALAACGPAAAVAFARATGRSPTIGEALTLAKQYGWTPQQGMAGAQSQVKLMNAMGVPTTLEQGVDWSKIAQSVQGGRPVIIDTPRHYLVVEGFDAQTGMFDFGNSGRVLKNSRGQSWFTPQQLDTLGLGGLRSSIYLAGGGAQPAPAAPAGVTPIEAWTGGRAYTVTGEFGSKDPAYPRATGHVGMDIGTPSNTPITSGVGGTIVHAGGDYNRGGYGNAVVVKTDDGHLVVLGHLGQVAAQVGQRVAPGAALGMSGSTGKSTGPHLHLEVRDPNGKWVDPRVYFGGRR